MLLNACHRRRIQTRKVPRQHLLDGCSVECRQSDRLKRPCFAYRRLFAGGLQCALRLLYIRVDVRSRLQCAECVDGHAAHRCSRNWRRSCTKFSVMRLDPCDEGLKLLIERYSLRADDQLMEILSMLGLYR